MSTEAELIEELREVLPLAIQYCKNERAQQQDRTDRREWTEQIELFQARLDELGGPHELG